MSHIIESLTEPPEGDRTYDQCRESCPDKVFWGNINVGFRPVEELRNEIIAKQNRAGKKAFALLCLRSKPVLIANFGITITTCSRLGT